MKHFSPFRRLSCLTSFLLLGVLTSACEGGNDSRGSLNGEWNLEITWSDNGTDRRTHGVLVIDSALPKYPDEDRGNFSKSVIPGRAYVDFGAASGVGRKAKNITFESARGGDRLEVIHVTPLGSDSVRIDLAPLVKDFDPVLTGRIDISTATGVAVLSVGNDSPPLQGTFVLLRRNTSAYSDSAHARAGRGVFEWNQ
jgi:hypothetical protein